MSGGPPQRTMEDILRTVGDEIEDIELEVYDLFSSAPGGQDLGMVDPGAETLEITVAKRDFTIKQSPGRLQSQRPGGTTGAAVWQTSVRMADWLGEPSNALFNSGLIGDDAAVIELGSGIAGCIATVLSARVRHFVATDQAYALKLMAENIQNNATSRNENSRRRAADRSHDARRIDVKVLDWEDDSITGLMQSCDMDQGADLIVACDCIYNYALIRPFLDVCKDACEFRKSRLERFESERRPTVCLIAQHLRQPDVFEEWINAFSPEFRLWKVKDEFLGGGLQNGSGFAVHLAMLR